MSITCCITIEYSRVKGNLKLLLIAKSKMYQLVIECTIVPFGVHPLPEVYKTLLLLSNSVNEPRNLSLDYIINLFIHNRCD